MRARPAGRPGGRGVQVAAAGGAIRAAAILANFMALFQSDVKDAIKKLSERQFTSSQERDELLALLTGSDALKPKDAVWMLF